PPVAPPGAVCDNAIPLAYGGGTYAVTNQTNCGLGNFYDNTCLGYYDGGEDIIYELTVTGDWTVNITLDPKGTAWTGFLIADGCPDVGTCLDFSTNTGGTAHAIENFALTAGIYYIMVDTWPSPDCIPDFDLTIEEYVPAYCTAGSDLEDEFVETITVGTINDGPFAADGITYHDYTATSTDMQLSVGYPITVVNGTAYASDQCTVWVDWNQNFDFYDAGEQFTLTSVDGGLTFTGTIVPPAGATLGNTRMRVRINYTDTPDPCGNATYGEVLDYSVNVIP
ncbi:MAG: hypothetical protein K8R37_06045, partial [Bacteroidales bacterium]|nr:hypothetical protein [Bacteroidales bacterium]